MYGRRQLGAAVFLQDWIPVDDRVARIPTSTMLPVDPPIKRPPLNNPVIEIQADGINSTTTATVQPTPVVTPAVSTSIFDSIPWWVWVAGGALLFLRKGDNS